MSGRAARALLPLLALLAASLACARSEWTALLPQRASWAESDYQLHWAAGRALAEGKDPYDADAVAPIGAVTGRPFTPFCAATPLFVRGFAWLGGLPFERGYRWLLTVNVLLLLTSFGLLGAALWRAGTPGLVAAAAGLALIACNDATWMALWYNQLNFVTLAAMTGALWAGVTGRPRLEGALLAVAAWAKVSPALVIVLAAVAGRGRTARAALVTGAALGLLSIVAAGWDAHLSWLAMVQRELGYAAVRPEGVFNNSLHDWNLAPNGVLSRAAAAAGWPRGAVLAGAWGVAIAAVGAAAWAVRRRGTRAFEVHALGITAGFLASGTTWVPHLSLAAVPLACCLARAWTSRPAWLALAAAAVAAVLIMAPLGALGSPSDPSTDILAKLSGCLLLMAALLGLRVAEDEGRQHAAPATPAAPAAGPAARAASG